MLSKAIEAIENPVERFVAQLKALDNGVSERVTRMMWCVPELDRTKLNLHIPDTRNTFVGQVDGLDGTDDHVTSAMDVYVSNEPSIQLRDMLKDAVESLRPQIVDDAPAGVKDILKLQELLQPAMDGSVGVTTWPWLGRLPQPLGADDLSAFSTNELIHELQERSTYSVVLLDDEEGSNIFNWHGEAHVVIGAMELTKAAILKPILEKQ